MKDAVDMANEAGGINGKKLQYFWKDGEYKDDVGIAAFKSLYTQYKPQIMWGQSTGMTKALGPEIKDRYKVLYSAYTFADVAANPKENPYLFIPGPTYAEMFAVLLNYIAKQKPGANVAFFYSDTEFGREPIAFGREYAKKLGLKVVAEEVTKAGGVDVTTNILNMKQKNVEFCIFQGYVNDPIAQVMKQSKDYGLKCQFMGTFWSTEKHLLDALGPLADEYIGVTAYSFYYQDQYPHDQKDPGMDPEAQPQRRRIPLPGLHAGLHGHHPDDRGPQTGGQGRPGDRGKPGQGPPVHQEFRCGRADAAGDHQGQQHPRGAGGAGEFQDREVRSHYGLDHSGFIKTG